MHQPGQRWTTQTRLEHGARSLNQDACPLRLLAVGPCQDPHMQPELTEDQRLGLERAGVALLNGDRVDVRAVVDLACDLLVSGGEGRATIDVAALSTEYSPRDAEPWLLAMLIEHGIRLQLDERTDREAARRQDRLGRRFQCFH